MASDNRPQVEYTPTTEEVREWYDSGREQNNWEDVIDPGAEFDRWLANTLREAQRQAFEAARMQIAVEVLVPVNAVRNPYKDESDG